MLAFVLSGSAPAIFSLEEITWNHILGTVAFLLAFCIQFDTHLRMASWRKDSKGVNLHSFLAGFVNTRIVLGCHGLLSKVFYRERPLNFLVLQTHVCIALGAPVILQE